MLRLALILVAAGGVSVAGCGDGLLRSPRPRDVGISLYERNLERARAVALDPSERPKRFVIADNVRGPGTPQVPPQMLDDALETVRLLGVNTVEAEFFGDQAPRLARRAEELGFTGYRRAVVWPGGGIFPWKSGAEPGVVETWAARQAAVVRKKEGAPPERVRLFHVADEPSWQFPMELREFRASPSSLRLFRQYLRRRGFEPGDFGASSWSTVLPIGQSRAETLPRRRLFYWTIRFMADSVNHSLRRVTLELRQHFSPDVLTTTNWNNRVSVSYYRTPNRRVANNQDVGPDTATGSMHWLDTGRARGVGMMWSEDWFDDSEAQTWGVYADGLRSSADRGPGRFGGFVVGRELGELPAGAKYKALTLIGHGAKAIEWFSFGPEERFPSNCWSNTPAAYGQIAAANRLIAAGEDLLYPGRPPQPRVALLISRSAQLWNVSRQDKAADTRQPLYERELYGLHHALTHVHQQVDFLDEQAVASGELRAKGYAALYVTAPNVELGAQRRIREWVARGGVVALSPGAGAADEYDSPSRELAGLRGGSRPPRAGAATRTVGRGRVVVYGSWPGDEYYATRKRAQGGGLPTGWDAALRRTAVLPARLGRVTPPVSADREVVEVQRLDSRAGTAVVLLNWTGRPIPAVTVRVRGAAALTSARSVESGEVSVRRDGADALVRLPLRDVDVLKLRRS